MMTLERINQIIAEETLKLNALEYYPVKVKSVNIVKATSFYADACKSLGRIRISFYFLNAPEEEIRATIMHELCHMVPEAEHGHGSSWKRVADAVNRRYPQYNIKRTGSNVKGGTEWKLRSSAAATSIRPVRNIQCKCTKCGAIYERSRESNLTLHPERYHCKCGGSIVRL